MLSEDSEMAEAPHLQPRNAHFHDQVNTSTSQHRITPSSSNGYRSNSITIDIPERRYLHSDEEEGTSPNSNGIALEQDDFRVPSQRISSLTYKAVNPNIRNRKQTAKKSRMQSRKSRKHTHIYTEWREDPNRLEDEILHTWRTEDEADQALNEEDMYTAKRSELRDMTIPLSRKKHILKRSRDETVMRGATIRKGSKLSCWTSMKYSLSIRRMHMKKSLENSFRTIGLWQSHLKLINSHFGTDVTAYFLFLRWLFVANAMIGTILLLFMFIPQMLYSHLLGPKDELVDGNANLNSTGSEALLGGLDGSGSGFWNYIAMFYSNYTNKTLSSTLAGITYKYNMKLAYFVTICVYFLIYFLVIAISAAKSYRKNFIESSGKFTFQYVLKIVDGWDYNLDDSKAAGLKMKNLYHELKEFCAGKRRAKETQQTFCDGLMFTSTRIAAVIIQLLMIGSAGVGVFFIVKHVQKEEKIPFLKGLLAPLTITLINNILPFIFSVFAKKLKFQNPKSAVYMTLTMTMLLYGVTLQLYFGITMFGCQANGIELLNTEGFKSVLGSFSFPCPSCWEERLGWRAYSLVFIDFLAGIFITLFSEVFYRICTQFCCKQLGHPQFDIARNTMSIIYNQFILWLGIYFGPLLTVIVVIKLLIIFFFKRLTVVNSCVPTTKPWRAAKMHTIFLVLLFVGFICCSVMYGVTITIVQPSTTCGPFTQQNFTYEVLASEINNIEGSGIVFDIIFSPGVVIAVIVVLCVVVHYVRVVASGKKKLIALLRIQITLEAKDKVYLRHMLEKVQKRQNSKHHTLEPSSQTQCTTCNGECTCGIADIRIKPEVSVSTDRPATTKRRVFAKEKSRASLDNVDTGWIRSSQNVITQSNRSLATQQNSMQRSTQSLNTSLSTGKALSENVSAPTPPHNRHTADLTDSVTSESRRIDAHRGNHSKSMENVMLAHDNQSFQR